LVGNPIQNRQLGRSQYGWLNHVNSDIKKSTEMCGQY